MSVKSRRRQKEIEELTGVKESYLEKKQPLSLFIRFLFKNFFLSVTNWLFILLLPLVIFALCVYLYPFFDVLPSLILIPTFMLGITVFSKVLYHYHLQDLFIKKYSNYITLFIFYFFMSMV